MYLLRHSQHVQMEEFNSEELKKIFRNVPFIPLIGPIASGKHAWQEEEGIRKYSSTNYVFPSSLKTFRTYWSFITGQCDYSEQLLPVQISCRMCVQFTSCHQFGIDAWRSNCEQKHTVFFLSVDPIDKSQGSWCHRLECTVSCTIPA